MLTPEQELKILNRHFTTLKKEKYDDAIERLLINGALEKFSSEAPKAVKNGLETQEKLRKLIHHHIVTELQKRYGPWTNFVGFFIDGRSTPLVITGYSNIDRMYKNDFGNLYSSYIIALNGVLLTSHCIDRFEERAPKDFQQNLKRIIKRDFPAIYEEVTSLDAIMYLLMRPLVWKLERNDGIFFHIRSLSGGFVLEKLDEIFIIKTFLPVSMYPEKTREEFEKAWLPWQSEIASQYEGLREFLLALEEAY